MFEWFNSHKLWIVNMLKHNFLPLVAAAPMHTQSSTIRQSQQASAVVLVAILSSSENGVIFGAIAFYVAEMSQQLQVKSEREWLRGSVKKYVICNNENDFCKQLLANNTEYNRNEMQKKKEVCDSGTMRQRDTGTVGKWDYATVSWPCKTLSFN